ncbi:MAG: N-acetylmuramoyl-L-alanine amidase [Candidatus Cloacimonetes bacterium]|nr:N-acetylmuramoyl-L-alanine amidase [Candidatus Cloacimonadota bacterium]
MLKIIHRILLTFVMLASAGFFSAGVTVAYKNSKTEKTIKTETISEGVYFNAADLESVFKSIIKEEKNDNRIYLSLLGEQFIFLVNSAYYSFKNVQYNMHYPLIRKEMSYLLPSQFLLERLPAHFPGDIQIQKGKLTLSEPKDYSIRTIVIDPGHGGKDPGAVGRKYKTQEKDVNLAVTLKLKSMLEKELGINVLLTRADDRFVSLYERTKYANDRAADLFVSIHANSSVSTASKGIEVYYLSTATTTESRAVEALENSVVELYEGGKTATKKYDDLAIILSDILQAEHLEASNNLASHVQLNLVAGTKAYDRGVKQANFYVLRGAFMPAILCELGFLSNPDEEVLLKNPEYQERMARTLFEGIKRFKFRYDRIRSI